MQADLRWQKREMLVCLLLEEHNYALLNGIRSEVQYNDVSYVPIRIDCKPVDVEGLLQWTMNQLQPLHLWEMPALVERDWNHILNPVRKDSSKQTTILVKVCAMC